MKIAISSSGKDLDSMLDPRFGRCPYYLIVELDDMTFEVFDNKSLVLAGGTCVQSARIIISKGVKAIITGKCGFNTAYSLAAAGIEMFLGNSGMVKKILDKYKIGELASTKLANVSKDATCWGLERCRSEC